MVVCILFLNFTGVGKPYSDSDKNIVTELHSLLPPAPESVPENEIASLPNTTFSLVQVSRTTPEANEICLKSGENGAYYMGWNDYRDISWSSGYVHLGFSYSTDAGNTWSENQILANRTPGDMHDCAGDPLVIPGSGDTVYYILMEYNQTEAKEQNSLAHNQLEVMRSDDHGQTWGKEYRIWPYDADKPWGDYYNGDVFVAWDNTSTGRTEFSHTINGDISQWTPKIQIPGYNLYPYVAINDTGAIFVTTVHWDGWNWDQMAVSVSSDHGNTFAYQTVIGSVGADSWESSPRSGPIPAMAVRGSDVYSIWVSKDTYSQINLCESHDGGKTWTTDTLEIPKATYIRYMYPSITIDSEGTVHLEYYRLNTDTGEINVLYRDYSKGEFGNELLVDSWVNRNYFIGDYSSIIADEHGNIGVGYTTENPTDNAMFAKVIPPIKDMDIHYGWNLISLPWQNTAVNITRALSDANWTRAMVYRKGLWYTYNKERISKYNAGFPHIDNKMGIWVYSTENKTVYGPGTDIGTTNITLNLGWNLVGYPSNKANRTVAEALSGIPYGYVKSIDASGNLVSLSDADFMAPGKGYWIYVTSECTWSVSW